MTSAAPGDWMKSPLWLMSISHLLAGLNIVLATLLFAPFALAHPLVWSVGAGAALLGLSLLSMYDVEGDWPANVGHFLAGLSAITVTSLFSHALLVLGIVTAVVAAVIGVKEAWIDPKWESNEDLVSGLWDWLGWMAGTGAGWGLLLATSHLT